MFSLREHLCSIRREGTFNGDLQCSPAIPDLLAVFTPLQLIVLVLFVSLSKVDKDFGSWVFSCCQISITCAQGYFFRPLSHRLCEGKTLAGWHSGSTFKRLDLRMQLVFISAVRMITDACFRVFPEVLILASWRPEQTLGDGFHMERSMAPMP